MQGNARETYRYVHGNVLDWVQIARGMQGNEGECQGNIWECKVLGECRGMPGERIGWRAKCLGNARECQGNIWEWVQSARGM